MTAPAMQASCHEADKEFNPPMISKNFIHFRLFSLSEQWTTPKSEVLTQTKASLWPRAFLVSF